MRGLTVVAFILLLIVALMSFAGGRFSGEMDTDTMMRLAYLGILASFVGFGFFSGGWRNVSRDLQALAFWLGALLILTGLYSYRAEFRLAGQRMFGTLVPGSAMVGDGEVTVSRAAGGMFLVDGEVNGSSVRFIFDTGASGLSLTAADAKRAGITPLPNEFTMDVRTANGVAQVAPVVVDSLRIGNITLRNVRASVSKEGALTRSLLGHSFLDRLKSYEVRGDTLILRN
jgi:aspartyl protease family protein